MVRKERWKVFFLVRRNSRNGGVAGDEYLHVHGLNVLFGRITGPRARARGPVNK